MFNLGATRSAAHPFRLELSKLGLHGPQQAQDLWSGKAVELAASQPVNLGTHDVWLLRIGKPR